MKQKRATTIDGNRNNLATHQKQSAQIKRPDNSKNHQALINKLNQFLSEKPQNQLN